MDLQLKDRRVLVMGASAGIGRAIAEAYVREGARVAICSRDEVKLAASARAIGASHYFVGDLAEPGTSARLVKSALSELGGLDVVVTNTGGPKRGAFTEIAVEQWHHDFQSLWMSVVEALNVALPTMRAQNFGRVLLVSSFAAKEPRAGLTTSNGLRAGLAGLIKSVANEYAPFGITLNLLLPGFTDTDRLKELRLTEAKIKELVPAGRLGRPEEIAALAAFLGSPHAGYITGQSIAVDGGCLRGH